jgi:zinc and cadmium transporter
MARFADDDTTLMGFSTIFLYGVLAAAANVVGGFWVTSREHLSQWTLRILVALGAGFMLAAVFLEVLPESLHSWEAGSNRPWLLFLCGYLLVQFFEHTVAPHFHFGEETHHEEMLHKRVAFTAVGALAIHTFFDGISIASGFVIDMKLGLIIFIAIMLHKLPEGFTVASIMLASGRGKAAARRATIFIGAATLLGVATVAILRDLAPYTLPLSAGVTLYVAASDLIPEVNEKGGFKTSLFVFLGVALYYLTDVLLSPLHL